MRIAIVAGELSGDLLGAGLIRTLRLSYPDAEFVGIGGPQMSAADFHSLYPLSTLSVMGLVEVLKHYRQIKHCRDHLRHYFLQQPPAVLIGIDAPDFNLGLELALRNANIPTVHYVSPSVWAWRHYRLRKIARACDLMLTLFPFEADYYQRHHIPVKYVGHPLADALPLFPNQQAARHSLNLPLKGTWVALLPGSRQIEVSKLAPVFLETAKWLLAQMPHLRFIVPLASDALATLFKQQMANSTLPLTLVNGQAHTAMTAADVVLAASGTVTLEAMLLKRPLVVAYQLAPLTYWLAKRLVRVQHIALPNLLAGERLVPEFLQDEATPEHLGQAVLHWLQHPHHVQTVQQRFLELHQQLRCSADTQAAQAIITLLESKKYAMV